MNKPVLVTAFGGVGSEWFVIAYAELTLRSVFQMR